MKHNGTTTIETDRLILRRFEDTDGPAMYKNWANDAEVTKYLMWLPHSDVETSNQIVHEWVAEYENDDTYQWAIVLKENGPEPIGCIGVVHQNELSHMMHIGYVVGRTWWHQGIMSECLKEVIDYLFQNTDVLRIESRHDPKNPNSGLVMQKCGMKYEGTLRMSDWNNQGICDAKYYSILRSEYEGG